MGILESFVLALGLAMDAFAVSICKGLASPTVKWKHMALAGLWFGGFQALMPLLGYLFGTAFQQYITTYDHWIAFVLLMFLGGKMILEAFSAEDEPANASFAPKQMLLMAIATSIDALAVGVTFAILPDVNVGAAVAFIGIITFILSAIGVKLGNVFGSRYQKYAELAGGIILCCMGIKILLEHLGIFA